MDADRLAPHVRRVVDAAGSVDDRLLVLLFCRKAEPALDLVEMLGIERGETIAALGRLSHAGFVGHHRPEGESIHWFATPNGKAQGEQLNRAIVARLAAEPGEEAGVSDEVDSPDHQRVRTRRRVAIDQNEKTGFSWD